MSIALALALVTATLNLLTAVAHYAISRAPGWRSARAFSRIAFTALLYGVSNVVAATGGLPDGAYVAASRLGYLAGALHSLAWLPFAFGGPDATYAAMPRPVRVLGRVSLAIALLMLVTGWAISPAMRTFSVPWAAVTYHYTYTTPLGDAYGAFLGLMMLVPFAQIVRRMRAGEPGLGLLVAGFTVFMACVAMEVLVANGVVVWLSLADVGFLAVVGPHSARMLRRFISDARRLKSLSERLEGEVRDRTRERDRAESALLESERLAALGRLAAGVGHEINNPLTYLQLSIDQIEAGLPAGDPALREAVRHARDGATRIQKVVEGLRTYSRRQDERRALDPGDVVRAALELAGPQLRPVATVDVRIGPTPRILGDESRMVQAVVNLLVNAAQAVTSRPAAGRIGVRTSTRPDGEVEIAVEDDGPGIAPEHRARLAEPYFTTRASQGGLGLGLFVTRGIVDAHGGRLELDPAVASGARMCLVLPALTPAATAVESPAPPVPAAPPVAPPAPAAGATATRARPKLLLVDDEPIVLRMIAQALAPEWDVTCAADGREALGLLERGSYAGILCDLMMPNLDGMGLAEAVARRDPSLRERMVFLSGGAVTEEAQAFVERPDVVTLAKPLRLTELARVLHAHLNGAGAGAAPGAASGAGE